jgi:hypothetical protein
LLQTLWAGRLKIFAETSELFTHAVFQLVVTLKNGVLGVHLPGEQKV